MPIYEYACQACGRVSEVMQKLSDPAPGACPACAHGPLVKIMSKTAFVLKGQGWYVTDFRDKGKKAPVEGESPVKSSSTEPAAKGDPAKEPTNSGGKVPETASPAAATPTPSPKASEASPSKP